MYFLIYSAFSIWIKSNALYKQVELKFGNVAFYGGRKTGEPGEKPSKQGREPTTNNRPYVPSIRPHHRDTDMRWHTLDITLCCIPRFWRWNRMVTRVVAKQAKTTKVKKHLLMERKTSNGILSCLFSGRRKVQFKRKNWGQKKFRRKFNSP